MLLSLVTLAQKGRVNKSWQSSPFHAGGSNFFGDDVGGAVGAAKHDVGFVVADDLLRSGIEG